MLQRTINSICVLFILLPALGLAQEKHANPVELKVWLTRSLNNTSQWKQLVGPDVRGKKIGAPLPPLASGWQTRPPLLLRLDKGMLNLLRDPANTVFSIRL